jgi:hypothetical protein
MFVGGKSSVGMIKKLSGRHTGQGMKVVISSRRDWRTQPGVLTPGKGQKTARPKGAVDMGSKISRIKAWFPNNSLPPHWGGTFFGLVTRG